MPELVAQKHCGGSILGDVQNLSRHGPGQPAPAEPVEAQWLGWPVTGAPSQPQPFSGPDSALWNHKSSLQNTEISISWNVSKVG